MKKKIIITLLAIVAVVCCALGLSACGGDNGNGGGNGYVPPSPTEGLAYEYNSETDSYTCTGMGTATATDVAIASQIDGKPVTAIGNNAFNRFYTNVDITSVYIPDSVISIGGSTFDDCTRLESVNFGNNSKLETIGERAFGYCISLESVNFGNNSKLETIGWSAFQSCSNLRSITIPDSVTSIGCDAFRGCTNLTSITIPKKLTTIETGAFYSCNRLIEVINLSEIPIVKVNTNNGLVAYYAKNVYNSTDFNSKIKKWNDYEFYENDTDVCLLDYNGNKTDLQLPDKFNGKGYEIYNYAFSYHYEIKSIKIPDSVTSIGNYAFYDCISLESVNFGNNSKLETIGGYAFKNCTSLESINIPDGVTSIGYSAFNGCTSLTSVIFENKTGWKVSKNYDMSNARNAPDLSDPAQNAEYFTDTYESYYWKREG